MTIVVVNCCIELASDFVICGHIFCHFLVQPRERVCEVCAHFLHFLCCCLSRNDAFLFHRLAQRDSIVVVLCDCITQTLQAFILRLDSRCKFLGQGCTRSIQELLLYIYPVAQGMFHVCTHICDLLVESLCTLSWVQCLSAKLPTTVLRTSVKCAWCSITKLVSWSILDVCTAACCTELDSIRFHVPRISCCEVSNDFLKLRLVPRTSRPKWRTVL